MYASRSVPVLNTPAPNAAYVDDHRSLPVAQQVVQMARHKYEQGVVMTDDGSGEDEYDEMRRNETIPLLEGYVPEFPFYQFVYKDPQNGDLKFEKGHIVFTEYKSNLVSSGFTGCLMMAFKFNQSYTCNNFAGGTITVGTDNQSYIAHVFCSNDADDTKQSLIQAAQNGCITIEALFKPNRTSDLKKIVDVKCDPSLIGTLKKNEESWTAEVKGMKMTLNENGIFEKKECDIRKLDAQTLARETRAVKALIYASQKNDEDKPLKMRCLTDNGKINKDIFEIFLDVCSVDVLQNLIKDNVIPGKRDELYEKLIEICSIDDLQNLAEKNIIPDKRKEIFDKLLQSCAASKLNYFIEREIFPREKKEIKAELKKRKK